jgi:chondroitin AC lyase
LTELTDGTSHLVSPQWILNDKVAYLFPQGGQVSVTRQQQSGSWYDINHTYGKDRLTKEVFTLSIEHGLHPVNATYSYIVLPGVQNADEIHHYQKEKNIRILANTQRAQIVEHRKLGLVQMICYEAGTYKAGQWEVTVDRPCAMMLKPAGKGLLTLHIADPGQTQSLIHVKVRQKRRSATQACDFRGSNIYAGATKTYAISLK